MEHDHEAWHVFFFFFLFLVAAIRWGLGATDPRQQSRDHLHLPGLPTETLHATERNQGLGKGSISAKEGMIVVVVVIVILVQQLKHPVTEILLQQLKHPVRFMVSARTYQPNNVLLSQ